MHFWNQKTLFLCGRGGGAKQAKTSSTNQVHLKCNFFPIEGGKCFCVVKTLRILSKIHTPHGRTHLRVQFEVQKKKKKRKDTSNAKVKCFLFMHKQCYRYEGNDVQSV